MTNSADLSYLPHPADLINTQAPLTDGWQDALQHLSDKGNPGNQAQAGDTPHVVQVDNSLWLSGKSKGQTAETQTGIDMFVAGQSTSMMQQPPQRSCMHA